MMEFSPKLKGSFLLIYKPLSLRRRLFSSTLLCNVLLHCYYILGTPNSDLSFSALTYCISSRTDCSLDISFRQSQNNHAACLIQHSYLTDRGPELFVLPNVEAFILCLLHPQPIISWFLIKGLVCYLL